MLATLDELRRGFSGVSLVTCCGPAAVVVFVLLMFNSIPVLHDLFNIRPANMEPLWTLGDQ